MKATLQSSAKNDYSISLLKPREDKGERSTNERRFDVMSGVVNLFTILATRSGCCCLLGCLMWNYGEEFSSLTVASL